jgi:hypothetical protein
MQLLWAKEHIYVQISAIILGVKQKKVKKGREYFTHLLQSSYLWQSATCVRSLSHFVNDMCKNNGRTTVIFQNEKRAMLFNVDNIMVKRLALCHIQESHSQILALRPPILAEDCSNFSSGTALQR